MAQLPQTQYAKGPGGDLAYQIVGDGPIDLVIVPGWFSHVDLLWADPGWKSFLDDLASFARVILYDKLGTGLSDPIDRPPNPNTRRYSVTQRVDRSVCCSPERIPSGFGHS